MPSYPWTWSSLSNIFLLLFHHCRLIDSTADVVLLFFEYLSEEKLYPLGTSDEYVTAPYEEYPITICGQTVILTNRELAAALFKFRFDGQCSIRTMGEVVVI